MTKITRTNTGGQFDIWLQTAKKGEIAIYYAYDGMATAPKMLCRSRANNYQSPTNEARTIETMAVRAAMAFERGLVLLFQRRNEKFCEYIAVRCDHAPAFGALLFDDAHAAA